MPLTKTQRKANKIAALKYIGVKSCKCGESRVEFLQFHHKPGLKKEFTIASRLHYSLENIKNELDKCSVVCAKCHRKEHYTQIEKCSEHFKSNDKCTVCKTIKTKKYRRRFKQALVEALGNKCHCCKVQQNLEDYDFHHIKRNNKEHSVSDLIKNNSWNKAKAEIKKCILVCVFCHIEIENNIENFHFKPIPSTVLDKNLEALENKYNLGGTYHEKLKKINTCLKCNIVISNKAKHCRQCYSYKTWPDINYLIEELKTRSMLNLAQELGVSDNGLRKHIKKYS